MDAGAILGIIIIVGMIGAYLFFKISTSGDRVVYKDNIYLKTDATIDDVKIKMVGLKGDHKYRTVVTFSDGFEFISHDTKREDRFMGYAISVTENEEKEIIKKAIDAHNGALLDRGMALPQKPFVCGKCGKEGPYEGNCPVCGSSLRKFDV